MSTVKSKKLQVGTDATATNNFTIYQPATPDGTLRVGVGNADSPTEVGRFNSNGYVATNAPAFSAYLSSNQSISTGTWTKIQYDTKEFDSDSDYDNTTNYRYTPSVAGYYQVNAGGYIINGTGFIGTAIYKNGSFAKRGSSAAPSSATSVQSINSAIIYMNGTTDYLEVYVYHSYGSARSVSGDNSQTYFQAFLAKAV